MRYISTEIQRDIIPGLPKYDYYPININCIDFHCMLKEITFGGNGDRTFKKYLIDRFRIINSIKELKFDVDEIDVYGFLITDTEENRKVLRMMD